MPKFGPALEATERAPGPQIRLLNHIFRVVHRAEHAVAVDQQLPAVRREQDRELLAIDRHGQALFQTGLPGGGSGGHCLLQGRVLIGVSEVLIPPEWKTHRGAVTWLCEPSMR